MPAQRIGQALQVRRPRREKTTTDRPGGRGSYKWCGRAAC